MEQAKVKAPKAKRSRLSIKQRDAITGALFITPSFLGFIFFSFFPLVLTLVLSVSEWNLVSGLKGIKIIGFGNFKELMIDPWFTESFINNILFLVYSLPLLMILGLVFAALIQSFVFGKKFFKMAFFFPYISSSVAVAAVWRVLFRPDYGPVNEFLRSIGMQNPPTWLMDTKWALFTIAMMYVWQQLGYFILIFITGIQSISPTLYEAAEIDGASRIRQFLNITVPLVSPTAFFLFITGVISSFKIFDTVQILTEGGPGRSTTVLVYYLYRVSFEYYRVGYGSAIAVILFVVVFTVTALQMRLQKRWVSY